MKYTIEYYYNLIIDNIKVIDNNYLLKCLDDSYYFILYNREESLINDLYNIHMEIKSKIGIANEIVLNINNQILTKINDNNYILMKVCSFTKQLDLEQIVSLGKLTRLKDSSKYENKWSYLWEKKIDYIENQVQEINIDKDIINSMDYYIGLTENAIYMLKKINYQYSDLDNIVLSHKRVEYPLYSFLFYNPNNYIFDLDVRDIAEYLKSMFFNGEDSLLELKNYLLLTKLTNYSYNMLFIRLLYPSYYFDEYEQIVNNNKDNSKLLSIIKKNREYEEFIKKAYYEISQYALIDKIDWLIY